MNKKDDRIAKNAFCKELENEGYSNIKIIAAPADICAQKDGHTYYFEIKMTRQSKKYFGAATLTEWEQAVKDPSHFYFVIALQSEDEITEFIRYSPEEFMKYSSIPPFKIFFNLNLTERKCSKTENKVTKKKIEKMVDFYKLIK